MLKYSGVLKMQTYETRFKSIQDFEVKSTYIELDSHSRENEFNSHIHNECEIYINLSGDVSFVVENNIYPITPGSIIITRPFEYHHCVYHSNKLHRHFWILFSALGNEYLFDRFYKRNIGENNLLILENDRTKELISVCEKLTSGKKSDFDNYFNFFNLINLIKHADVPNNLGSSYPDIVINAMTYINNNLSNPIKVGDISKNVNVSINTLERYFIRFLNISPTAYIKKMRLSNAAKLLSEGCSVFEASKKSGFSDCSGFIALFRKTYGQTPYVYKKNLNKMSLT